MGLNSVACLFMFLGLTVQYQLATQKAHYPYTAKH